jgi:DNA-binding PadR family transcriptional regulator
LSEVPSVVLALVIERPSYVYEVWQRFEQRFGSLHNVASSRIYKTIDQLERRGFIEKLPPDEKAQDLRQPKPHYRATAAGARYHREWLATSIQEDPRREELLRRLLATTVRDSGAMLKIVDAYERSCLDAMARRSSLEGDDRSGSARKVSLRDRLIDEERRVSHEGHLQFVAFARHAIKAESEGQDSPTER